MRAGTLDTRVVLQRSTTTLSPSGSPTDAWVSLATRWAAQKPLTGFERNGAQQWIAREQTQFTLRWSADIDDLSPLDRLVCPADDAGNSPLSNRSIYDIMAVHEPERHVSLIVMAARRVA